MTLMPLTIHLIFKILPLLPLSPHNSLGSSISTVDFSACNKLTSLVLSSNYFVGLIPSSISQIPNLKVLDLSSCNFSDDILASFAELRHLERLSLEGNLLNGTVPSFLDNLTNLKEFCLASNTFLSSQIPSEFGDLACLENLWLASCNLVGHIPPSLTRLNRLWNLDLSVNGLTGSIPCSITEMAGLVQVELYNNSLSGELPVNWSFPESIARSLDEIGSVHNLVEFSGDENRFTGELPGTLVRLAQLNKLDLSGLGLKKKKVSGRGRRDNILKIK